MPERPDRDPDYQRQYADDWDDEPRPRPCSCQRRREPVDCGNCGGDGVVD